MNRKIDLHRVFHSLGTSFAGLLFESLDCMIKAIDGIVSGMHRTLAILETEALEVGVEEIASLTAERFLVASRFLFSFKNEFNRIFFFRVSPWTFDKALLVLAATDGRVDLGLVPLDTQSIGEKIGNFLGTCITVDRGLNGDYLECFLRIRVNLPINELLKRCVMLRLARMNLQNN
ncbi:unnamed protein product, partial [Prunus brigantina]